jgi:glycosyltransferase involved in cell wall biosynthesis
MIKLGFVMEQTLGHVTHHQNLARWVAEDADVCPTWLPIEYQKQDRWERLPGVRGNWSLKASLRARDALRDALRQRPLDALFLHTQTVALFAVPFMQRVPSIVSLDATPLNYDTVGQEYGHNTGNKGWLERRKYQWNRATFHAAAALVTWCQWAKDSLVADYGVAAEKVTVIPPGVDMARWRFGREKVERLKAEGDARSSGPTRLLFVGADFARKGGPTLVEAFRSGLHPNCVLDIVTKDESVGRELAGTEGVRVHYGLTANSEPLRELYAAADLFVFPTRADCLPIAVMEAMAAGLPVIATNVGALREEVEDGVNGLIVPPSDAGAVAEAVRALAADGPRRRAMAAAGRRMAEERFDAQRNYGAILALMKAVAHPPSPSL